MKTKFTLLFYCCFIATLGSAQYSKGDIAVNAGISLGLIGYSYGWYGNSSFALPLNVNLEYSINDKIAVGPYLGYFSRAYSYGSYKDRFTVMSFGGRLTFHASQFLNDKLSMNIDAEKWDFYGTVLLGYENHKWKYDAEYTGLRTAVNSGRLILGPVFGTRYMAGDSFGLFGEVGRGTFGWLTIGATLRLKAKNQKTF
jgi:hypothetical protein